MALRARPLAVSITAILALAFAVSVARLALQRHAVEKAAWEECHGQAQAAAGEVQKLLGDLEGRVHTLAEGLSAGRVRVGDLPAVLESSLTQAPACASRMGVMFAPFAADPAHRLRAPSAARQEGAIQVDAGLGPEDYTGLPWFQQDLRQPNWNDPHAALGTGDLLVDYSEPFRLPGASSPSGVVRVEVTMKDIQKLVGALAPGSSGYGFLLSDKGVYLADPVDEHVRNRRTFESVARELGDQGRLAIARAALGHRADFRESVSSMTDLKTWIFLEPVPAARWSLGTVIIKDELVLEPHDLNRTLAKVVTLGLACGLSALFLLCGPRPLDGRRLWILSTAGSVAVAAAIGTLWYFACTIHDRSRTQEVQVMSLASRDAFLRRYSNLGAGFKEVSSTFVPTGIFIQQLELSGDNRMRISGQVWERLPKDFPVEARGVVFPEAVTCEMGAGFIKKDANGLTLVQPFRGVFPMQTDSTVTYPFDRSSVRLRIWPKLFYGNTVLVPDLEAYTLLVPASLPGIDKGLGLSGWRLNQSRFSFIIQAYNTNFGISDYTGQQDSPELAYAFSLKRNFINPFIATFLPILVVAGLMFTLLMTSTRSRDSIALTGYNTFNILRAVISLFFPVVIAQINLRNHILTEGLLYVEYYYFVIYLMVLLVAVNALAVAYWDHPGLQEGENRIAKVLFWPFLTLSFYGISVLYLL